LSQEEVTAFFKFMDQAIGKNMKDRYLITRSKVYHQKGVAFPFKRVITIKDKLPKYGRQTSDMG
jgi:hypothetical protein